MNKWILSLSRLQIAIILFILSSAVVLLFWVIVPGGFQDAAASDYLVYYKPLAINLIQGNGFVLDQIWAMRYPPGFPVFLAFFLKLAIWLNVQETILIALMILLFSAGSSVLMFFLGDIVWGKGGGIICSLFWIAYPFHLWLTKQPNSEPVFIFFLLLGILLVMLAAANKRLSFLLLILAGFSGGIGMLIRPIAIGLGVVLALIYLLISAGGKFRQAMGVILILSGNLFAVFPWEYATYLNTGKIIPLASQGTSALLLAFTFPVKLDGFRLEVSASDDVKKLAHQILTDSQTVSTAGDQIIVLINNLREAPISFIKLMLIKLSRVWYGSDTNRYDQYSLIVQVLYLGLLGLSIYLSAGNAGNRRLLFGITLPSLIYFWMMTIFGMPLLRYMVPSISLLFLFTPALIRFVPLILAAKRDGQI